MGMEPATSGLLVQYRIGKKKKAAFWDAFTAVTATNACWDITPVALVRTDVSKEQHLMKNGVFWDVTPRDFCKNRRFGGT
jgi:hypothetical protein